MRILIAISGSVAAYKIPLLARMLLKRGHEIRFVLTSSGAAFVAPAALQAIAKTLPQQHLFADNDDINHIELARWAQIMLIAPATANTIAKIACGIGDNLLTTLYLATRATVIIAPAMNKIMWQHPATQRNCHILATRNNHFLLPVANGEQACGDVGDGRMLEAEEIVAHLEKLVFAKKSDYQNIKIVITAGATREAIDPVRYISNHSSGKMAYALAAAAQKRGANVLLISAATLATPVGVTCKKVTSALEMYEAALQSSDDCNIFIAAAAVSDYRVANPHLHKHKKGEDGILQIELIENPDIVAAVAHKSSKRPFVVGFAAETQHLIANAQRKLQRKNLDLIIANDVGGAVFGSDDNEVIMIDKLRQITLPRQKKTQLAQQILDHVIAIIENKSTQ